MKEIEALDVHMAVQNHDWGYPQIQGALSNLGHELARNTIANILQRAGIEPAPERVRKTTWKEFLARHRNLTDAVDRPSKGKRYLIYDRDPLFTK